jgi:hypothetical protein
LNDLDKKEIVRIVCAIAESTRHSGLMLNERYLHHCFSHMLQNRWNMLDLIGEQNERMALRPEWPTYKKQTGLRYGQYRKKNGKYVSTPKGTAGFIDFAVGDYAEPEIGVELLKYGCDLRTRDLYLIVTEIAQDNNRRHWHYEKGNNRFEIGLPEFAME